MLVVVHDDDAIDSRRDRRIIVVLVSNLDAGEELHPASVQVRRELLQQRHITSLPFLRKGLEIHHESLVMIRGKEEPDFTAEAGAGFRAVEKV